MDARPLARARNQTFLGPVGKQISKSTDLCDLLVAHHDRSVPPTPESLTPADDLANLAGNIAAYLVHEARLLLERAGRDQQVQVIAHAHHGMDFHASQALSAADDASHRLGYLTCWAQQ